MTELRKAAQDVIDCVDSPYIPDEIRMVNLECINALREALALPDDTAEPMAYITRAALDALQRGASSSVRVWRKPDERLNGDVALYTKE